MKSFDRALSRFLHEHGPAGLRLQLEQDDNVLAIRGGEMTGKQRLNRLVHSFDVSPEVAMAEAFNSLDMFKVDDPNCPHSWTNAFIKYEVI
jgi:hypothetical protein